MSDVTRAEVCAAAIADAFADDGEIFASPMGLLPMLGARLAKLTSQPRPGDLRRRVAVPGGVPPLVAKADVVEGWIPFRRVFDVVAYGKRHVMMGATQIDRHGNQNISAIGDFGRSRSGSCSASAAPRATRSTTGRPTGCRSTPPGSSSSRSTSSPASVRARREAAGPAAARFNDIHRIVTDLGVLDVERPRRHAAAALGPPGRHRRARCRTASGCELARRPATCPTTRAPDARGAVLIREVLDPKGLRDKEVRRSGTVIEQLLRTPLTDLVGVRHPVVQTGMGWVAGPRLVTGTANAGGLGILASATMTLEELEQAILEVKEPHRPAVRRQPARRRRRRGRARATC